MARLNARQAGARILSDCLVVALGLAVVGVPLWLVLITSVKSTGQAQSPDFSWPTTWQFFENYSYVFTQGEILFGFATSLIVVLPSVILVLVFGAMAAWFFGRRTGRASRVIFAILISGILLPPAIVTIVFQLRALQIDQSAVGLVAVYTGLFLSTAVFFMTGFVRTIPHELEEAARIDGARPLQIFRLIVFPLLRPAVATAAILITLFAWNDIYYSFFILGGSTSPTLPLNLYRVSAQQLYINNWNYIFAFITVMSLPIVALFVVGQRSVVSGITGGAVK